MSNVACTLAMSESLYSISYVCDIEGNLDYWNRFLSLSRVVYRDKENNRCILAKNCHFVFGGDATDRGPGDIRILDDLIKLKEDYPEFVHLIHGNRDVNKIRLPFELKSTKILNETPEVFWVKNNQGIQLPQSRVERLKWILSKTMGSPEAFEYRRTELKEMNKPHEDDDVFQSFLDLLQPDGNRAKYLLHGEMCCIFGETLFVHGCLHEGNIWFVPPYGDKDKFEGPPGRKPTLQEWADELNAFAKCEARDFVDHADEYIAKMDAEGGTASPWSRVGGYGHPQPGANLANAGVGVLPDDSPNQTVIYSAYLLMGKTMELGDDLLRTLNENGVKRVVVGHQPVGDLPAVLRYNKPHVGDLQVLCCDTSYASAVKWGPTDVPHKSVISESADETSPLCRPSPSDSTRGVAVSELVICVYADRSRCFMHGILSNGCPYEYELPQPEDNDAAVGTELDDHWIVRATVPPHTSSSLSLSDPEPVDVDPEPAYVICRQEGWTVQNRLVSRATLESMRVRPPIDTLSIELVVQDHTADNDVKQVPCVDEGQTIGDAPVVDQDALKTPEHVVAPTEHVVAPPEHVVAPPEHVITPPEHVVAPPVHVVAPPGHVVAPPEHARAQSPIRIRARMRNTWDQIANALRVFRF